MCVGQEQASLTGELAMLHSPRHILNHQTNIKQTKSYSFASPTLPIPFTTTGGGGGSPRPLCGIDQGRATVRYAGHAAHTIHSGAVADGSHVAGAHAVPVRGQPPELEHRGGNARNDADHEPRLVRAGRVWCVCVCVCVLGAVCLGEPCVWKSPNRLSYPNR